MTRNIYQEAFADAALPITQRMHAQLRDIAARNVLFVLKEGMHASLDVYHKYAIGDHRRCKIVPRNDSDHGVGFAVYFVDEAPSLSPTKHKAYGAEQTPLIDLRVRNAQTGFEVVQLASDKKGRIVDAFVLAEIDCKERFGPTAYEQKEIALAIQCALTATGCKEGPASQMAVTRLRERDRKVKQILSLV